jgi:hypothetical protein
MVRHIFLWSVKDGEDGGAVLEALAQLRDRVPGIRGWSIGAHEGTSPNSSAGKWQYALTCDFDSFADLDAYQEHPFHQELVTKVGPSYQDWAILDYTI